MKAVKFMKGEEGLNVDRPDPTEKYLTSKPEYDIEREREREREMETRTKRQTVTY